MCARSKIHAFNFMDPPEWSRTVVNNSPQNTKKELCLSVQYMEGIVLRMNYTVMCGIW
jgi:hypothetical protein